MDGMTIAECIGDISEEIIERGLRPPKRNARKNLWRCFFIAAMLVIGVFLGIFVKNDPYGWIRGGSQGFPFGPQNDVYEIVRLEEASAELPLYLYTVTPEKEVFATVKEKYGSGFDTAIRVFRVESAGDEKQEYYWFPLVKDGEVKLVVYASVTRNRIYLSSTDMFNGFLNTVSKFTNENSPGYIVANNESFFCVAGEKAYCTDLFYDQFKFVGDISLPKGDIFVITVN
ncbi:MAG: hypothetical protein II350_08965 [Clostridia bacterium]|nr:hypothetical protein [Clostridia bacterium]